jgi:hypothetical protein
MVIFLQKIQKNHTSSSDTPPFTYTIERITHRDIELDQVEDQDKPRTWA